MRRKILALTGVVALLTTAACGGGDAAEKDGLTTLKIGSMPVVDTAALHLGVDQGYFEDLGIELDITNVQGGAEAIPGVVSGDFDIAFSNVTSLIVAREKDLPLKIINNAVASTGKEGKDFGGVVVPEGSSITGAKDLAGKKVAVNTLQNIGDTTVRNSVRKAGGDPEDIEFVEMAFPDMPAAVEKKQVDAAWVVEPFLTMALNDGATEVASNFVDTHESLSVAVYFTSEKFLAENPELAKSFTTAMSESQAYAQSHPEEVRRILTTYTKMDENLIEQIRLPNYPSQKDTESAQVLGELMKEDGLIDSEPNLDELYQ
ncbi:NitT/TauT family transport system substrate-binding protein [Nocardiopsis mwathae]|uniref:NitT/TauT family transport system substrate-binding protein n=1 Tax=Nocardiopsis mwathae TaxID=1472723 RepID=A0A7W9YF45_9ACTN|nr:ABC transporter substrate-binding protein [Nocardiopsis mwathae]MBB6170924.1 NitT/TauT family transport system substrate-binding protein [Nocardiopsis mwathae]